MGGIQNDVQVLHFLEKLSALYSHITGGIRALCISSGTVVRRPERAETISISPLEMVKGND